jgi:vacuolar iron transporter family protein
MPAEGTAASVPSIRRTSPGGEGTRPGYVDTGDPHSAQVSLPFDDGSSSRAYRRGVTNTSGVSEHGLHDDEPHEGSLNAKLNWLRAGVLGANDGIISTAGLVIGVAGATTNVTAIATAGVAGVAAGALSMAVGEYVSVSTQRDTERAMLDLERRELLEEPEEELAELVQIYVDKGLSHDLADQVARELTAKDALAAHADAELGLDPNDLTNPWHAAGASLLSFALGGLLPLLTITLLGPAIRVVCTFIAVLLAVVLTGSVSARIGQSPVARAVVRNVVGGALAMIITFLVGRGYGAVT